MRTIALSRRLVVVFVSIGAALLVAPATTAPQSRGTVSQETADGLHVALFKAPQGSIQVYLPDDLAAGDTISGTVSYTPSGRTDVEREKSLNELRGYVVDVAGEPVTDDPAWVRVLPELPGPTLVRFRSPRGAPVGEAPIPTLPPAELPPPPTSFEIPTFGEAGKPVKIGGPFSGAPAGVTVGGQEAPFLAQSPRQTIARVPSGVVGPTTIGVDEDGQVAEAPFRVLTVALSADKLDLKRGERTTLHLEVGGLEGLEEPIPLTLTNRSPQVIRLGGTEIERVTISPRDVASNGVYRIDRPIESLRAGGFAVNAVTGPAGRTAVPVKKAQEDEKPPCTCTSIDVETQYDERKHPKVTAAYDSKTEKVTLAFNIASVLACEGRDGKCSGRLTAKAEARNWTVTRGTGRASATNPENPEASVASGAAASLNGACPKPKNSKPTETPVTVGINLKSTTGSVLDYSGFVTLEVTPACGGNELGARTFGIFVSRDVNARNEVVADLSDLDHDGTPDFFETPAPDKPKEEELEAGRCKCKTVVATPSSGQKKPSGTAVRHGSVVKLAVSLPYTIVTTCEKGKKNEKTCAGSMSLQLVRPEARPSAQEEPAWRVDATGNGTVITVEKDSATGKRQYLESLLPAEIPCSAKCAKSGESPAVLEYRAALRADSNKPVTGIVEIKMKPSGNCSGTESSAKFEITVSVGSSPKVTVVRKP